MLAQLIPKKDGPPITLHNAITIVGRSSKYCDLVVPHTSISKQHCVLVKTDGLLYLRDLGSTNGTRVNGQRVIRGALLPGDQLSFAGFSYRIHLGPDPESVNVSQNDPTEMISVIDHNSLPDSDETERGGENSNSDVRFLRDSDVNPRD